MNILNAFYKFICPSSADNKLALLELQSKVNGIMTTLVDIKAALAKTAQDVASEKEEVAQALGALTQQVNELKASLAAGTVVSSEDLDSILADIGSIGNSVSAIYTTPDVPEATPIVPEVAPVVEEVAPDVPEATPVVPEVAPVVEEVAPVVEEVVEVIAPVVEADPV